MVLQGFGTARELHDSTQIDLAIADAFSSFTYFEKTQYSLFSEYLFLRSDPRVFFILFPTLLAYLLNVGFLIGPTNSWIACFEFVISGFPKIDHWKYGNPETFKIGEIRAEQCRTMSEHRLINASLTSLCNADVENMSPAL